MKKKIAEYNNINAHAMAMDADPHRVVELLLNGAYNKISFAKGCMQRQDLAGKGESISLAITILDTLQASLNKEVGGEMAVNLSDLYLYMMDRLLKANLENKVDYLDEVNALLLNIKTGWEGIRGAALQLIQQQNEGGNRGAIASN
jgi:flagellar protein FliS